jgi:hypothetical protein
MPGVEVKSVDLLGMPVPYAYAVKAGPWIFLTGHEAFDFESGIPEAVAGPPGFPLFGQPRSRREGDFTPQRMRRILREFGLTSRMPCGSTSSTRTRRRSPPTIWRGTPSPAPHPAEHLGRHGAVLRRREHDLDLADRGGRRGRS